MDLKNKVEMVAAASKGLGFGVADAVAAQGARVSIASRTLREIDAAARVLQERHGSEARGYSFDANDSDSIARWVASTREDFGRIDCLVVNAGGPPSGNLASFDDAAWESAFHLTLMSAVRMIRSVLPEMSKNQSGCILTITSSSVKEPIDNLLLSNVFRAGVVGLVKSLSNELASLGIRINNIIPGRIDTDRVRSIDKKAAANLNIAPEVHAEQQQKQIPLGRYGTIEEFGSAAAFLLSDRASYITGISLTVDGGKMKTVW